MDYGYEYARRQFRIPYDRRAFLYHPVGMDYRRHRLRKKADDATNPELLLTRADEIRKTK